MVCRIFLYQAIILMPPILNNDIQNAVIFCLFFLENPNLYTGIQVSRVVICSRQPLSVEQMGEKSEAMVKVLS